MRYSKLAQDVIYYLITGINNIVIRIMAASLRRDNVNHFLDEMFYITSAASDAQRKPGSPTFKTDKPKQSAPKLDVGGQEKKIGSPRTSLQPHSIIL